MKAFSVLKILFYTKNFLIDCTIILTSDRRLVNQTTQKQSRNVPVQCVHGRMGS